MFIQVKRCEGLKDNCIKLYRNDFGVKEPKKNTMVHWLSGGFSYSGIIYHKDTQFIYVKVVK